MNWQKRPATSRGPVIPSDIGGAHIVLQADLHSTGGYAAPCRQGWLTATRLLWQLWRGFAVRLFLDLGFRDVRGVHNDLGVFRYRYAIDVNYMPGKSSQR